MSAIYPCARAAHPKGIPVIADGGIKYREISSRRSWPAQRR